MRGIHKSDDSGFPGPGVLSLSFLLTWRSGVVSSGYYPSILLASRIYIYYGGWQQNLGSSITVFLLRVSFPWSEKWKNSSINHDFQVISWWVLKCLVEKCSLRTTWMILCLIKQCFWPAKIYMLSPQFIGFWLFWNAAKFIFQSIFILFK